MINLIILSDVYTIEEEDWEIDYYVDWQIDYYYSLSEE